MPKATCPALALLILLASPALRGGTDWGSSHFFQVNYTLSEKWFLIHRSLLSTRDDFNDTFFAMGDLAVGYKLGGGWSARAGYRKAWLQPADDWLPEDRPFVELRHFTVRKGFLISNRPRFEFRFYEDRPDHTRFRHELVLEAPWKFTPLELRPYLEEEVFYSFNRGGIEGNWFTIGLAYRPSERVKLKLGHRWLMQKIGSETIYRNVVSTGLLLFF